MTYISEEIDKAYQNAVCIYTKEQIDKALDQMANAITAELANSNPIILTVLKGGLVFAGNLIPRLHFPLEIDNVHATRYQNGFTGKDLLWKYKPETNFTNRTVLLLDDVLDLGITLKSIAEYCYNSGAQRVYTAVLLDKKVPRDVEGLAKADFVGLSVEDRFVFGYGLDYQGYWRNAPGIFEAQLTS